MVTRAAVLAKASEWVGMLERTGNNDIWFAEDWGILGQSWCFAFVQSCFYYADPSPTGALPHQSMYCPYGIQWARDNGQAIEVGGAPTPGDVVFFSWDMNEWPRDRAGTGDHVGIVEAWDGGDTIHTIEGNIGSPQGVYRKTRSISGTVVCFWRPTVYGGAGLGPVAIQEDDMFEGTDRDNLKAATETTVALAKEVHDIATLLGETFNRAAWTWNHVKPLEGDLDKLSRWIYTDTQTLLNRPAPTQPQPAQPGPLPPVGKPEGLPADTALADRVANLESGLSDTKSSLSDIKQALAKLLDQAKPAT